MPKKADPDKPKRKRTLHIVSDNSAIDLFHRTPTQVCVACGKPWADHTDEEWRLGCQQFRSDAPAF